MFWISCSVFWYYVQVGCVGILLSSWNLIMESEWGFFFPFDASRDVYVHCYYLVLNGCIFASFFFCPCLDHEGRWQQLARTWPSWSSRAWDCDGKWAHFLHYFKDWIPCWCAEQQRSRRASHFLLSCSGEFLYTFKFMASRHTFFFFKWSGAVLLIIYTRY